MPHTEKGRADKVAPDKISTDLLIEELKSKIELAEYEHKATFEKCEQEKQNNFKILVQERKENKVRRTSTYNQSDVHNIMHNQRIKPTNRTASDAHNIMQVLGNKNSTNETSNKHKSIARVIETQDEKVCEAIKKYNLKVYERREKQKQLKQLEEEVKFLEAHQKKKEQNELNSPDTQKIRLLENNLEKLKMKINSAQLISSYYTKIISHLKQEIQNYPWKLDELETELIAHQRALGQAAQVNQDSQSLMEQAIQDTKQFHEEYFESKKNRDKMLANARKDVDKAHKELKALDKTKIVKAGPNTPTNPMQDIINKEAEEALLVQQRYEQNRKKRVEYEGTASYLKNACKVSSKDEILPAIMQQQEVQKALKLQIDSLEDQKTMLEIEKEGVDKEYRNLKFYGEKKTSDIVRLIEEEAEAVNGLKDRMKQTADDVQEKTKMIQSIEMAAKNFFMLLQKYKIDPQARQLMTGQLDEDFTILGDKLQQVYDQISAHGKVAEFLENPEFLDYMEDTLPKTNIRVNVKGEEDDGGDVFDDESTTKATLNVMTREDIKRASQKIVEKNQGRVRRKKAK